MNPCALCPRQHHLIPPDGPCEKGGLLFIGEAPGAQEERGAAKNPPGRPFVGKTGQEVDEHYLPLSGLRRERVTFWNAICCYPTSAGGKLDPNAAKDQALLASCANANLYPLIERMQPKLIVPMGSFACKAVCPEVDLDLHHGIPVETPWGIPAFPQFHPALGLHSPKQMLYIRTDWQRLRKYLNGTLTIRRDAYPNPDYREVDDAAEIESIHPEKPLAADTESSPEGPFCFTYTQHEGAGRLVRAERDDLLSVLGRKLRLHRSHILFHNWLYDWPITESLGLSIPNARVVDTMVRAYHLGNLPQGLKALSFRELGMGMQDFADLVRPYSAARVLAYYEAAAEETWERPDAELVRDKDGKLKLYQPQSMNTKLKRFFTDYRKNPEGKDVFKAWDNWESDHALIEGRLGTWRGMDIRDVPFDQVITYACRDSDATLRLWNFLRHMPAFVRHVSQEHWRERAS